MNTKEFEASENCYCNECCEKEQCSSRKRELNCAYSVRNVLRAILYAVNHIQIEGFEVTVEVTTKNGMIYPVKFAYGDKGQVKITKTLLISDSSNISICDITKVRILSGNFIEPKFEKLFFMALNRLMRCTGNYCGHNSCCESSNGTEYMCFNKAKTLDCARGMQR